MKIFQKRGKAKQEKREKPDKTMSDSEYLAQLKKDYKIVLEDYKKTGSEKQRLQMVELSDEMKKYEPKQKKKIQLFKKPWWKKITELYCPVCKHSFHTHHRKGRSTGCRKCGCLATVDQLLNPDGNGKN